MSSPKEMGKPVAELTRDELKRERSRCATLLRAYPNKPMAKGLRKRLRQIDKRIDDLDEQTALDEASAEFHRDGSMGDPWRDVIDRIRRGD